MKDDDREVGARCRPASACLLIYSEKFMSRRHCIQISQSDPKETRVFVFVGSFRRRAEREDRGCRTGRCGPMVTIPANTHLPTLSPL